MTKHSVPVASCSKLAALLLVFAALPVWGQVYKCQVAGKVVYADQPCPSGANELRPPNTSLNSAGNVVNESDIRLHEMIQNDADREASERAASRPARTGSLRNPSVNPAVQHVPDGAVEAEASKFDQLALGANRNGRHQALAQCYAAHRDALRATHEVQQDDCLAQEQSARAIRAAQAPDVLVNCDASGCMGTSGQRYNGSGGSFIRSDGRLCLTIGTGLVSCP